MVLSKMIIRQVETCSDKLDSLFKTEHSNINEPKYKKT